MTKIRVFIVDDSVVARRILRNAFASESDIEVVGMASNGRLALDEIPGTNPDLVTLDIEMPEMGGIRTLQEIRKAYPRLPVIMVSAINPRDASTTLDALALGASDYVMKPTNVDPDAAQDALHDELIPKVRALCSNGKTRKIFLPGRSARAVYEPVTVLAIGVSTGGPKALAEVLQPLAKFHIPILIVQHMPPIFTQLLAERLSIQCGLPVHEAKAGDVLKAGEAWLAPGNHHMRLEQIGDNVKVVINQEPAENACRPSVDVLLRSIAEVYGSGALAAILTGMGSDGLLGCRAVAKANGQIIVQDEATSVVWGMPGAVARAGLAEKVLPLPEIAGEILQRAQRGRVARSL